MPRARIEVNAVVGSDEGLPINVVVQLSNDDLGDETSYLWSLVDKPEGSLAALSAPGIENPTITPDCEGTYVVQLVVDNGLPTQASDVQILGVRELKQPDLRVPGATETLQAHAVKGWAVRVNKDIREFLNRTADPGTFVGRNNSGGNLARGDVVRVNATTTLKSGLPGQEDVPDFAKALATVDLTDVPLYIVERGVDGVTPVANGMLLRVRALGQFTAATGAGAVLDQRVWVSDVATLSLTPGTFAKQVGVVQEAHAGDFDVQFVGGGGLGSAWEHVGNTLIVDDVYGDDALGQREGHPYKTVAAALADALSGDRVYVRFGTYTLTSALTIPANVTLQGDFNGRTLLQLLNVTADTSLVTLDAGSALLDILFYLTSAEHHTLVGIERNWGGASAYNILHNVGVTVDNSGAGAGVSNVYGAYFHGAGSAIGLERIATNLLAGVVSTGNGNKRGLLVDGGCPFTAEDSRFEASGGAVSNVGAEVVHAASVVDLWGGELTGATADALETAGLIHLHGVFLGTQQEFAFERVRDPTADRDAVNARTWCGQNTLVVDGSWGNDATGAREGPPYATVEAALADAQAGDRVYVKAGTYTLSAALVVPDGVLVQGDFVGNTLLQLLNVTADTALVTLGTIGTGAALRDLELKLTSVEHHTLIGIDRPTGTSIREVLRNVSVTVDNSGAGAGASNIYGLHFHGAGSVLGGERVASDVFAQVLSTGNGDKRGLLVDEGFHFSGHNCVFVAVGGAVSNVAVEVNHAASLVDLWGGWLVGATAEALETLGSIHLHGVFLDSLQQFAFERVRNPAAATDGMNARTWCGENEIVVDATYGDDTTGAREGPPYATLQAALADPGLVSGDVVRLTPGTHAVTGNIPIPSGVTIRGAGTERTTVLALNLNIPDFVLFTMGTYSVLEDLSVVVNSNVNQNYVCIDFPNVTAETAVCRHVRVLALKDMLVGASTVIGVHHSGIAAPAVEHFALDQCEVYAYEHGGGTAVGLYGDTAGTLRARNCTFFGESAGADTCYGVQSNHANAILDLHVCSARGLSGGGVQADLQQTLGSITFRPVFKGTTSALCVENPVEPTAAVNARVWCGNNTLRVDPDFGITAVAGAAREGPAFSTFEEALAAAAAGDTILLSPGTHAVAAAFVLPASVHVVGAGQDLSTLAVAGGDIDVTACTMGDSSSLERLTLKLLSIKHHTYKGVEFGGTTGTTAWLDNVYVWVLNSAAGVGVSNVYGIHHSGTGVPSDHVAVRNSHVRVHSVGTGNKRALLSDGGGTILCQNTNLKALGGTGSRVACETNHATSAVGFVSGSLEGESSDVLRTLGEIDLNDTRIVSGTAGNLGFTGSRVTTLQWTCAGAPAAGFSTWLRTLPYIGAAVAAEDDTCRLYARRGGVGIRMTVRAVTAPGGAVSDVFTLYVNGVSTGLNVVLTGAATTATNYAVSGNIAPSAELSVVATVDGASVVSDVAVEVDVYWS